MEKIILESSDNGGWCVKVGPRVEFMGKRPECKRAARGLCSILGVRSWWNRKDSGELVEIFI